MARSTTKSTWAIDPAHSLVEFAVKHMMIATVKGRFTGVEGTITADPDDLSQTEVSVRIDAATVDTREQQRDEHLRSADFFEVETFPEITFASTDVTHVSEDEYKLTGDLTIRDVTRPVSLDVTFNGSGKDPWGNQRLGFSAEGKVNRKDFGLTWNTALETGGFLVGDDVKISIEVQAVKQGE